MINNVLIMFVSCFDKYHFLPRVTWAQSVTVAVFFAMPNIKTNFKEYFH
jgi:hypothetical protein